MKHKLQFHSATLSGRAQMLFSGLREGFASRKSGIIRYSQRFNDGTIEPDYERGYNIARIGRG